MNIAFSVIYYVGLCNDIIMYCVSHFYVNKGQNHCVDIVELGRQIT